MKWALSRNCARLKKETYDLSDVAAVADLMAGSGLFWWFAGGWAIDLFLGRVTRAHSDIEVGLFRRDQHALRRHLCDWTIERCAEDQWLTWEPDFSLALPDFQLKANHDTHPLREFEFFLDDEDAAGRWICRRFPSITIPRDDFTIEVEINGRKVRSLRPEMQLFYKAKYHRPKDESDFSAALQSLTPRGRSWLGEALSQCYGQDPWLDRL
jgi:hypothetical protein